MSLKYARKKKNPTISVRYIVIVKIMINFYFKCALITYAYKSNEYNKIRKDSTKYDTMSIKVAYVYMGSRVVSC